MNKSIIIISLCLLVSMQFIFTEGTDEDDSSDYAASEQINHSEEYSILGHPLSDRRFFITIKSPKSLIKSGMSAFSAIGWFFGGIAKTKKKILNFLNIQPPKVPDVLMKLKIIEIKLNQNYENAVDFKNSVTRERPGAETDILISREGFYCDAEFCEQAGDQQYGMGICTPYYCDCSRKVPKPRRCSNLFESFDPVYRNCADAFKVKVCGF